MREEIFNGNSVDGPSTKHRHMKCLHFKGAKSLTVSDSPESVPLPRTADGANAATTSSSSDSVISIKEAMVLFLEVVAEVEDDALMAACPIESENFVIGL